MALPNDPREKLRAEIAKNDKRNAALFFDEYGTPIELPTIMEALARAIDTRIGAVEVQHKQLIDAVEENTGLTKKLLEDTTEIVAVTKALSGAVKVIEYGGKLAKPLLWLFGFAFCAYAFVTSML